MKTAQILSELIKENPEAIEEQRYDFNKIIARIYERKLRNDLGISETFNKYDVEKISYEGWKNKFDSPTLGFKRALRTPEYYAVSRKYPNGFKTFKNGNFQIKISIGYISELESFTKEYFGQTVTLDKVGFSGISTNEKTLMVDKTLYTFKYSPSAETVTIKGEYNENSKNILVRMAKNSLLESMERGLNEKENVVYVKQITMDYIEKRYNKDIFDLAWSEVLKITKGIERIR